MNVLTLFPGNPLGRSFIFITIKYLSEFSYFFFFFTLTIGLLVPRNKVENVLIKIIESIIDKTNVIYSVDIFLAT